ncbi:MAG: hypothetical protein IT381_00440 [Deltaproteobacteria bacterium]|nr:hypothetical protein [Deltaproteobacteria bacterium]
MTLLLCLIAAVPVVETKELRAEIHVSETAQIFHIVDQLSNWGKYQHQQYRRALTLDAEDEALLREHAAIRKARGYGLLDHAFYTDDSREKALATLPEKERDVERRVLDRLAPKLLPFIAAHAKNVAAARDRLQATPELQRFTAEASRFFLGAHADVPVYLMPSVEGASGGGYNGDRLTLEVAEKKGGVDAEGLDDLFFHELWHAFAAGQRDAMKATGLDVTTLSEGFAHAAAPGIYGKRQDLVDAVSRAKAQPWSDNSARFDRLGLALLPSLNEALRNGETFTAYLPRAVAIYRGLEAVSAALENTKPRFFCFGEASFELGKLIFDQGYDTWMRAMNAKALAELRSKFRPSDVVVFVLAGDEAIPPEFRELFSGQWSDVEASRKQHAIGTWSGKFVDRQLVVTWAKDVAALRPLVAKVPGMQTAQR